MLANTHRDSVNITHISVYWRAHDERRQSRCVSRICVGLIFNYTYLRCSVSNINAALFTFCISIGVVGLNRKSRFILLAGINRNFIIYIIVASIVISVQLQMILFLEDGGS